MTHTFYVHCIVCSEYMNEWTELVLPTSVVYEYDTSSIALLQVWYKLTEMDLPSMGYGRF